MAVLGSLVPEFLTLDSAITSLAGASACMHDHGSSSQEAEANAAVSGKKCLKTGATWQRVGFPATGGNCVREKGTSRRFDQRPGYISELCDTSRKRRKGDGNSKRRWDAGHLRKMYRRTIVSAIEIHLCTLCENKTCKYLTVIPTETKSPRRS